MTGTPKTLLDAIANGLAAAQKEQDAPQLAIKRHVRDYLSQCFTVDLMDDPKIVHLWKRIIEGAKDAGN
jgi:hypothetical protein